MIFARIPKTHCLKVLKDFEIIGKDCLYLASSLKIPEYENKKSSGLCRYRRHFLVLQWSV